ncbi:MAG: glycosyl hydrolase family 17 [Bacteroidia bacterium]
MLKLSTLYRFLALLLIIISVSCSTPNSKNNNLKKTRTTKTATQILGDSNYLAICYGGYRYDTRDSQPTITQIKEDMKLLNAMGIKVLRTYNTKLKEIENILESITELQKEDSTFELYVMLGAWIDCENAWTNKVPNHENENEVANSAEIKRAVDLANKYPGIVKMISVGNEARVKWATAYYVQPNIVLKWVNYLQNLKKENKLDKNLWVTSSDNFASWGGGDTLYHGNDLEKLIQAVDFVSIHTYPVLDTHYDPEFWGSNGLELQLPKSEAVEMLMQRAVGFAQKQYTNVVKYIRRVDSTKQIHIGETGWASSSDGYFGSEGSKACDEFKAGIYYKLMRKWTNEAKISCFYFEAFDEKWKAASNIKDAENHFGLFTIDGQAKYGLWHLLDKGVFKELKRDGNTIVKTYGGKKEDLLKTIELPQLLKN